MHLIIYHKPKINATIKSIEEIRKPVYAEYFEASMSVSL